MLTGIATIILLLAFIGGVAWAYSKNRQPEFDAAARIPLDDANPINVSAAQSREVAP